jgi:DNA-damage-inducible protein J
MTEKIEDSQGWKTFLELRQQAQCSVAAGMSDAEVEAEIAAYRSGQERNVK